MEIPQVQEKVHLQEDDLPASTFKVTWTDQGDREQDIRELNDGHIVNLNSFLLKEELHKTQEIIMCELERRVTGEYPSHFFQLCLDYRNDPETWRLKIYL